MFKNKKKNDNKPKLDTKTSCYAIFIAATAISFFYIPLLGVFLLILGIILLFFTNRANIMMYLGYSQYNKNNFAKGLKLMKSAHLSSAGTMNNSYHYAYMLLREGRCEDAKSAIRYAMLRGNLKDSEKYRGKEILSLIHYRLGDYAQATEIMQTVFEHYKSSNVYGSLGYYKILAKAPDAESFALEAYDYNKDDKVILDNLVQLYLNMGELEKAKKYSDEAIAAQFTGIETFYHAALVEKHLGNKKAAIDNFKKALSFTPTFLTTVTTEEIQRQLEILEKE